MKESELLKKLKKESQEDVPDVFDEIMSSARRQGIVKPSSAAKMSAAHAAGASSSGIAVKIVSVITALAITASAASVAGVAIAANMNNPQSPPAAELPDGSDESQTPGGGQTGGGQTGSGSGNTHVCNFVYDSTIPATCTGQGYDLYTCAFADCTKTKKENYTAVTDHDYVWTEVRKATCAQTGLTNGVCSACGATDAITYPKTNEHNYGIGTLLSGKCGQQGTVQHECADCGYKETDTGIVEHEYVKHKCVYCDMYGDRLDDGYSYYQSRLHYTYSYGDPDHSFTIEDVSWMQDCEIDISYITLLIDRNRDTGTYDVIGVAFNLYMHTIELVGSSALPAWYQFYNCGIYDSKLQGWVDIGDSGSVFDYELPEYTIVPEIQVWDHSHNKYVTFTFDSEVTVNRDEGYVEFILKGEGKGYDENGIEFRYTFVSEPIKYIYDTCPLYEYHWYKEGWGGPYQPE